MNTRVQSLVLSTDVFGTYVFGNMQPNPHQMPHLSCQWHCREPARLLLPLVAPLAFRRPTANRIRQADETMIFLHRQASLLFLYLINSAIATCYSYVCNCLLLHFIAGIIHLFRFFSAFIYYFSSRAQSFIHRPARGSPQEQTYTSNARHNG